MRYLLLILFLCLDLHAYPRKSIELTDYKYNQYVRPQFKSLLQDYHALLLTLNPEFRIFKISFSQTKELLKYQIELPNQCNLTETQKCVQNLQRIKALLVELKNEATAKLDLTNKEYLLIDEKFKALKFYNQYKNQITKSLSHVEDVLVEATLTKSKNFSLKTVKHEINLTFTYFYLMIGLASDNRFTMEFDNFWMYFMLPIYRYILVENDREYFITNINELNTRINALTQILTKGNKEVSVQVKTQINVMHNRWNSVLKTVLNPMVY
jgi:hypothetical protein